MLVSHSLFSFLSYKCICQENGIVRKPFDCPGINLSTCQTKALRRPFVASDDGRVRRKDILRRFAKCRWMQFAPERDAFVAVGADWISAGRVKVENAAQKNSLQKCVPAYKLEVNEDK